MPRLSRQVFVRSTIVAIFSGILLLAYSFSFNPKNMDFLMFYSAAQMIRHGEQANLYDLNLQQQFQSQYTGQTGLVFNYPPATALLYTPVTVLKPKASYIAWTINSMVILALCAFLLNRSLHLFRDAGLAYMFTFVFLPTHFLLMEGQIDSVILLAYAFAFVKFRNGRLFLAGLALSLGLFKFHLVLPFVLLLALRRQWRMLAGFAAGSAAFLAVCFAVSGWQFVSEYYKLLVTLKDIPWSGYNPAAMGNLHGLLYVVFRAEPPAWVVIGLSAIVFVATVLAWRKDERGFAAAMTMTLVVSYHLNPHDLVLLVIPLAIALATLQWRSLEGVTVLAIGLPVLPRILVSLRLMAPFVIPMTILWYSLLKHPRIDEFAQKWIDESPRFFSGGDGNCS